MEVLKCELCGKEFKNKAGLGGHKAALHGEKKPTLSQVLRDGLARLDTRLSAVEGRCKALEVSRLQQSLPLKGERGLPGEPGKVTPEAVGQALVELLKPQFKVDKYRHMIPVCVNLASEIRHLLQS